MTFCSTIGINYLKETLKSHLLYEFQDYMNFSIKRTKTSIDMRIKQLSFWQKEVKVIKVKNQTQIWYDKFLLIRI